ncbi:MAG: VOC family protein [Acidimicrobiales bacterium]|nr:VOC family protein [Acidimicrobiales bacterium]
MRLGYVIIYVPDVEEAVDFYERAFGISRAFVHESGDFAQMATGDTALAFTSHRLGETAVPIAYTKLEREDPPPGFEFTLLDPDVATAYQRAVDAGAEAVAAPHATPWGQTVSYVRDPYGVLIGIASPMG